MGDSSLLIRQTGKSWRQPEVLPYENERGLQDLLLETPSLIEGVGPAAVVDEFGIHGIGIVDIVAVEPNGQITLVECKLKTNSEMRRTVVGQALAYASGCWRMSYETFAEQFAARAGGPMLDLVAGVAQSAGIEWEPEAFRQRVSSDLDGGLLRLCIAVDEITDELRSIIEFLNTHTTTGFEVLLLELGLVSDGQVEILIPHVYGTESARIKESGAPSTSWSTDDVFAALTELCSSAGVSGVRHLFDWIVSRGATFARGRGAYAAFGAYLRISGHPRSMFSVYADPSGPTAARISLNFGSWRKDVDTGTLDKIATALEAVPALAPTIAIVRAGDYAGYPTLPIDGPIAEPGVAKAITDAWETNLTPLLG